MTDELEIARRRQAAYWMLGFGLTIGALLGYDKGWLGSAQLHTVMEVAATLLAFMVGAMALVRYYSKKEIIFLFIGAGFLGTGFLDGYHAVVTSAYFKPMMPSDSPSLIPWSWVASRQFLSIFMVLSWVAWTREARKARWAVPGQTSEHLVYWGTAVFTIASFLFFAFVPLSRAYYPELFFRRPEEFGPALFFLVALIGYLRKGHWRHDAFEHWLILSLIVGFLGQAIFMSHSDVLFDYEFDIAHLLKKVSYVFVLTGLMISMFVIFRREEATAKSLRDSERRLRATVDHIFDGIIIIDEHGLVQSVNPGAVRMFGYPAEHLVGRNVNMLSPEPYHSAHDSYIRNYVTTGQAGIIGKGREVEGLRADGTTFPMELQVAEFRVGDERLFLGITRDISERKVVDRMKDEFVSTVSHELRTPLTVILGYLPVLTDAEKLPEPAMIAKIAGKMEKSGKNLLDLLNDLLDVSKIEAGKLTLDLTEVDLAEIIRDAAAELGKVAGDKGLSLEAEAIPCRVIADRKRLRQALINLLGNAIKFTEEGQIRIRMELNHQRGEVAVSVSDTGPGIPEDRCSDIFERFKQVDGSSTRNAEGTGLGLAITKNLVELHGGRIRLDSTVGEGSTFTFTIPLAKQKEAEHV